MNWVPILTAHCDGPVLYIPVADLVVFTIRRLIGHYCWLLLARNNSERSVALVQVIPHMSTMTADVDHFIDVGGVLLVSKDDGIAPLTALVQCLQHWI